MDHYQASAELLIKLMQLFESIKLNLSIAMVLKLILKSAASTSVRKRHAKEKQWWIFLFDVIKMEDCFNVFKVFISKQRRYKTRKMWFSVITEPFVVFDVLQPVSKIFKV